VAIGRNHVAVNMDAIFTVHQGGILPVSVRHVEVMERSPGEGGRELFLRAAN
jgi:hypothetical protein